MRPDLFNSNNSNTNGLPEAIKHLKSTLTSNKHRQQNLIFIYS